MLGGYVVVVIVDAFVKGKKSIKKVVVLNVFESVYLIKYFEKLII